MSQNKRKASIIFSPILTITLFSQVLLEGIKDAIKFSIQHKITQYIIFPIILTYLILNNIPGEHQIYVNALEWSVEFFVWWFGLGVLSSIGLGTGMHTGVLFLFPHIFKFCFGGSRF